MRRNHHHFHPPPQPAGYADESTTCLICHEDDYDAPAIYRCATAGCPFVVCDDCAVAAGGYLGVRKLICGCGRQGSLFSAPRLIRQQDPSLLSFITCTIAVVGTIIAIVGLVLSFVGMDKAGKVVIPPSSPPPKTPQFVPVGSGGGGGGGSITGGGSGGAGAYTFITMGGAGGGGGGQPISGVSGTSMSAPTIVKQEATHPHPLVQKAVSERDILSLLTTEDMLQQIKKEEYMLLDMRDITDIALFEDRAKKALEQIPQNNTRQLELELGRLTRELGELLENQMSRREMAGMPCLACNECKPLKSVAQKNSCLLDRLQKSRIV